MQGCTYPGFDLRAGVRQGCPLSPLVYALAAELLLDKLEHELGDIFVRAYADDTAVLVQNLWRDAPLLAEIFEHFEKMSNLRLNLKKAVAVSFFPLPSLAAAKDILPSSCLRGQQCNFHTMRSI